MPSYPTLLHALFHQAKTQDDAAALRFKDKGSWHDISWTEYKRRVLLASCGLQSLGMKPGDRLGIVSTNRVEWLMGDLGGLAAGCITVPIYPSSIAEQVGYILEHSEATGVYVEDNEQLRKVASVRERCPQLKTLILLSGDAPDDIPGVVTWEQILERGEEAGDTGLGTAEEAVESLVPDEPATIVYTSGTTGPPKGATLSHTNIMAMADSLSAAMKASSEDSSLSFLPLSHVAERLQGEIMAIRKGYTVNMGEGLDKVAENLVETEPTLLVCVPRLWEKYYSKISSGIQDAPDLRKKLFYWATGVGKEVARCRREGQSISLLLRVQHDVASRLVLGPVRKKLGMARGRSFLSGAAPLSAEVGEFFASLGIIIQEVYGQTECCGVCTFNPETRVKYGTVGPALTGLEVKLAEDGEILVKGDNVFLGYYKQPQATAETVVDGWLHTGDVGEIDAEGYFRITDRKKDIIVTAGGKNVSPQNIENRLKTKAGISQVVVVGDKRKFLSCLITLDTEGLSEIWERDEKTLPSDSALPEDKEVQTLLQTYIDEVNGGLSSYETLKTFAILPEDFTVDSGELTPSLKVKRRVIQKRYEAIIDGFYSEKFA